MRHNLNFTKEIMEKLIILISFLPPFLCLYGILSTKFYFLSLFFIGLAFILDLKGFYFPKWMINLLGLVFIFLFFLDVSLDNFLEKSLQTLLLFLGLKLLEKKKLRDYFQIYLLEFLLLAGASFYYSALWFFLALLFQVFYIGLALFIHLYLEEGEIDKLTWSELKYIFFNFGILFLSTLALGLVFFLALPRVQNPLFNIAGLKSKATTGFAEQISLGTFSEIQESTQPAFRIAFDEGKIFDPENLYFRVIVFDTFDGITWSRRGVEFKSWEKGIYPTKKGILGKVYMTLYMEGYLPSLYELISVMDKGQILKFADNVLTQKNPSEEIFKYEIYVQRERVWKIKDELSEDKKNFYLQVPKLSPSIIELSQRLKGATPEETLNNILQFFSKEGFRYSLKALPLGKSPLEDFLFKEKRGNCEYFASATAILLRLNGIPARIVGGYRGAIYQERGKYYLVLQKFAHSWVEAWIKGSWKLIDPTPAASLTFLRQENKIYTKLKLFWDTINYYYIKFILDYDLRKQKKLLSVFKRILYLKEDNGKIKGEKDRIRVVLTGFKSWVTVIIIFVFLGICLWIIWNREKIFQKREKRLLMSFLKYLEKRGYPRRDSEGIFELIEKIKDPFLKEKSLEFAKIYSEYYYRDEGFDKEGLKRLEKCLKDIQRLNLKQPK